MKTLTAIEALKSAITLTEDLKKLEANGEHGRLRIVFEHHDKDLEQRVMALMERYHSTAGLLRFALKVAAKEQQRATEAVVACVAPPPAKQEAELQSAIVEDFANTLRQVHRMAAE